MKRSAWAVSFFLLLTGCATTPEDRIRQNPALFDSLGVVEQAQIRAGRVELGFTEEMVRLAMGEPTQKYSRRTQAGETICWVYQRPVYRQERQRIQLDNISGRGAGDVRLGSTANAWATIQQTQENLQARVEFQRGIVTAIEKAVDASAE